MKPLHHKTHTLAKRGLSLLCVLALCLSLLPATALAAGKDAPDTLYVGNQSVRNGDNTTYWVTNGSGGLESSDANANWDVKYDPATATLTLNGATITGNSEYASASKGAGIYALSRSGQPVSLTIELIGENTITGIYGIYVNSELSENSYGTDASLTITDESNGSLKVSGSYHGIYVKSGTGGASLNINDASVVAKTTYTYSGYAGVYVQSSAHATSSPQLCLKVNGGSLTASASEGNDGIQFYVGAYGATSATTSLSVTDNAIVDARTGGISASGVSINPNVDIGSTDSTGGIVFDGTEGTVYGDVTLQEDITIGEGESLTIGKDASLTVPSDKTLTNDGTVTTTEGGSLTNNGTINNSGTLTDNIQGSAPPKITTTSLLPGGTVGTAYSQSLAADNNPTSWSVTEGDLPDGLSLNSDGTITGTPTTAKTYNFTVTATNDSGSDSKQLTLTVTQPVTGVTLDQTELALYIGDTATLNAMVAPSDATNQAVTWKSDAENIATVDQSGNVKAVAPGTATITATAADGSGKSATCTVTVTDKTYTISADTTALNFGSAYTGYAQPASKTVTVKNTGNQPVTLTQPASTSSFEVGTLSKTTLAAGDTATFTVQPKAGLSAGTYSDTITVSGSENVTVTITASFTVKSRPSYNPPTVSEETTDAIKAADPGETVTVDLSSGSTKLDKEVFEALAGKDVTLVVDLGDGVSWTVNGTDVPENADFTDIDMGVTMNSDGIPVEVVNAITGERGSVQLELAHDGAFGFTMTLTAPLGAENAGYWANLYHFNEEANAMTFETAAPIGSDGSVSLALSHASQYAIVIDDHNHGIVTLPFTDVSADDWFYDPVCYVYSQGLMTGTSATTFEPNISLSRAMLVAVLHRLEGNPQASAGDFTDVADGDWYAQAVNWAASVGVVNGFDDGTFQPNAAITREQLAAILRNYAVYKGMDVTATGSLSTYTDANSVSDWAKESVEWVVGSGLLGGYEDNTLRPQGDTMRAEASAMLQRYLAN